MTTTVSKAELRRLRKAEDVCWTVLLMMGLGLLPIENDDAREFLAMPMQTWADEAEEQGILRPIAAEPEDLEHHHEGE